MHSRKRSAEYASSDIPGKVSNRDSQVSSTSNGHKLYDGSRRTYYPLRDDDHRSERGSDSRSGRRLNHKSDRSLERESRSREHFPHLVDPEKVSGHMVRSLLTDDDGEDSLVPPGVDAPVPQYVLTKRVPYSTWKERLYKELEELNCLFAVEPNMKRKTNMPLEEEFQYRSLAKAIIIMRLDDDHLNMVVNFDDPLKVMKVLNDCRDPETHFLELRAQQRLNSMVYDSNVSVCDFLRMFEDLIHEVEKHAGERMTDIMLKQQLLSAIISDFPDIMAESRKPSDKVTYEDLKQLLIKEVERRNTVAATTEENVDKMGGSRNSGNYTEGGDVVKGMSVIENDEDYMVSIQEQIDVDKRIQILVDSNPRHPAKDTSCQKCGAYGHLVGDCKRRDNRRKCYSCRKFVDDHVASSCPEKIPERPERPERPDRPDRRITEPAILPKLLQERARNKSILGFDGSNFPQFPDAQSEVTMGSMKFNMPENEEEEEEEEDDDDDADLPPIAGLRKVYHIRRKMMTRRMKTGRTARKDLIFTDNDFYMDVEYREMFVEEDEKELTDIVLEIIQVMSID